jgi:hypothetical protein
MMVVYWCEFYQMCAVMSNIAKPFYLQTFIGGYRGI